MILPLLPAHQFTLPALLGDVWGSILAYVFIYPLLMSFVWILGSVVFYLRFERRPHRIVSSPIPRDHYPLIAILVPCFNEAANVEETIQSLMDMHYPNYEVVAINDGSQDNTGELLNAMADLYPRLRVVHLLSNQGKAVGLNTAALMTRAEILLGIDGDARLDRYALDWLVRHFDDPQVGAVTGNPRVRSRSTLLGRIQVGEFSSTIGLIKRAQRSINLMFTVSGVITAFRRSALHQVGYWNPDKLTEDVDISWRLQLAGWALLFEPRALCWILMPETLNGLWRQRLRWSMGGTQVLVAYWREILRLRNIHLWPLCIEYTLSIVWAGLFFILASYRIADLLLYQTDLQSVPILLIGWAGLLIGSACLCQMLFSLLLDRPYDQQLLKNYFWMIWYPVIYWVLTAATSVAAVPALLFRQTGARARWISPDRGIKPTPSR